MLVIAEEDAGKVGRVQDNERNTNAATYRCSALALMFFPPARSHSHAAESAGGAEEEEAAGCRNAGMKFLSRSGAQKAVSLNLLSRAQVLCELRRKGLCIVKQNVTCVFL